MELDTLVKKARIEGYNIKKGNENSTIQTKRGEIDVIMNEGKGQPHCYLGRNQIQLFKDNKNLVDNLVHERDHFQIFPYDFILTGTIIAGTLTHSANNLYQTHDWKYATALIAMETILVGTYAVLGGLNSVSDGIIYARKKFGTNKK